MNRYALALLLVLSTAWLAACGSADSDPANVTIKPITSGAPTPDHYGPVPMKDMP